MSLTDFWKIHPRTDSRILEHKSGDIDQFLENSSENKNSEHEKYITNF